MERRGAVDARRRTLDAGGGTTLSDSQPAASDVLMRVVGLDKSYGGLKAVDSVTFDIYRGEVLALVGDNGAGKSTLIKAIAGAQPPDAGHVEMEGTPLRMRTPRDAETGRLQMGATPWHQDGGVVTEDADETEMITVWFPLWDAPEEAGCLEVIPYSHRAGLQRHCPSPTGGGPSLHEEALQREAAVALPMRRGDVLFMTRYTQHASLPNRSERMRWSFDLRYNPVGQPTGREVFPGFVARSRRHPESELRDARAWAQLWYDTRARMAAPDFVDFSYNRWTSDYPGC